MTKLTKEAYQKAVEEGGNFKLPKVVALDMNDRGLMLARGLEVHKQLHEQPEHIQEMLARMTDSPLALKNLIVTQIMMVQGMLKKAWADGYCAGKNSGS